MKGARVMFTFMLVLVLGLAGRAAAAEEKMPEQQYCPVTGSQVDGETQTNHEGRKVYLCCSLCVEVFKAEPAKYTKKLDEQKVKVEMPQTDCPVTGNRINRKFVLEEQGHYVYFCCNLCRDEFKKEPGRYLKKMEARGVMLEKAPDRSRDYLGASEGMPKEQQP